MSLDRRLTETERAERQAAAVALLRTPLLTRAGARGRGPAAADCRLLPVVQRHAEPLRRWFLDHPGWPLRVDAGSARLTKFPVRAALGAGGAGSGRGLADAASGRAFTRRRYALVLLVLAALEHCHDQTLVSGVARRVASMVGHDPLLAGRLELDFTRRADREDVVAALRFLESVGVLRRIDGDEQAYVSEGGGPARRADALYDVHRGPAASVVVPRSSPALAEQRAAAAAAAPCSPLADAAERLRLRVAAACDPPEPQREAAVRREARENLYRRLLDDPVVYFAELPEAERGFLRGQRKRILGNIAEATGLAAEVRAEGIALLDEDGSATDLALPTESTDGHAALLLAEKLADARRAGREIWGRAELEEAAAGLIAAYGRHWKKAARDPGGEALLLDDALALLGGLGLVRVSADGRSVASTPAVCRYAVGEVRGLAVASESPALFGEEAA